ncbi:MAG: hypothetical protein UT55_C0007G0012 [Candidatus Peregrinibacteria bacterium GW2011_GWE2_39_6]|nr:MAG: hypothetical protein UT36_C0001G0142 [Candidatus Peregrinibacteria bacterium GW2011_GWF2_39_17]KKR26481.1 MAG: hypothetical protein UT55_C0007G0012 [Candidatus Peregrinibacteria bacterium GW2011_GWE2_39_6]HCW32580.1 hypothetical protein [Candidatus Peregrinibacteria bacterium]
MKNLLGTNPKKFLPYILVSLLGIMSVLLNNLQYFWLPNGTDEYVYMGIARRMIIFENKLAFIAPFQGSALLYSYWLGIVYKITGVPLEVLTRFCHATLLFLLIFLGYHLGKKFSESAGIILAALIAFIPTPVFYPGQTYVTPSFFSNIILLLLILTLTNKPINYKHLIILGLLEIFLFWWGLFPILIFVAFYYFFQNKPRHKTILLFTLLIAGFYFLLSYESFQDLSPFFKYAANLKEDNSANYWPGIWGIFKYYLPALLGLPIFFLPKEHRFKPLLTTTCALLGTIFFIYFLIGGYAHLRILFFSFLSILMIFTVGYLFVNSRIKSLFLKTVFSLCFIIYILFLGYRTGKTYAVEIAPIPPAITSEMQAFEWLQTNYDMPTRLIVSDAGTIFSSNFYVNSLTAYYYQNFASDNESADYAAHACYFYATTPKMYRILKTLSEPILTLSSIDFLNEMKSFFKADDLFIIISPRTRMTVSYFDQSEGKILYEARINPRDETFTFAGETKFKDNSYFEQIYDNEETQIYRYIFSN